MNAPNSSQVIGDLDLQLVFLLERVNFYITMLKCDVKGGKDSAGEIVIQDGNPYAHPLTQLARDDVQRAMQATWKNLKSFSEITPEDPLDSNSLQNVLRTSLLDLNHDIVFLCKPTNSNIRLDKRITPMQMCDRLEKKIEAVLDIKRKVTAIGYSAKNHPKSEKNSAPEPTSSRIAPPGEWSRPMSKTEMRVRLDNLSPRKFATFTKSHPIRPAGNRQQFQIRIDGMDSTTRKKLEKP